jgi:hypothetical protein
VATTYRPPIFTHFTNSFSYLLSAIVRKDDVSAIGCINTFQFIGGAVDELITGAILDSFGTVPETSEYSRKVDSYSFVAFAIGNLAIGWLVIALTKDADFEPRKKAGRRSCCRRSRRERRSLFRKQIVLFFLG